MALDLHSRESLEQACGGVRQVVHLAALNHASCAKHPDQAFMVNCVGTFNLLQAAASAGVERFLYFSTAHVYGSPLVGNISELSPLRPASLYAITHRAAEDLVLAGHDRGDIAGVVLRLSNALGAPADPQANAWMLIANDLCRQAVTSRKLTLRSSGLQVRDFIALSDVARAVEHVLALDKRGCGDGLFNLGGESSTRIIDLAERIAKRCSIVLGFTPEICRPEPEINEAPCSLAYRMEKLKATGFNLQGSLDDEIDATLFLCQRTFGQTG